MARVDLGDDFGGDCVEAGCGVELGRGVGEEGWGEEELAQ